MAPSDSRKKPAGALLGEQEVGHRVGQRAALDVERLHGERLPDRVGVVGLELLLGEEHVADASGAGGLGGHAVLELVDEVLPAVGRGVVAGGLDERGRLGQRAGRHVGLARR